MPELPEVETIRADLATSCVSKRITKIQISASRIARKQDSPDEINEAAEGRAVKSINRRGKFLLFILDSNDALVLHLGMTGQLLFASGGQAEIGKHTHAVISFAGGERLLFNDARKFGQIFTAAKSQLEEELNLGPEPLSADFSKDDFALVLRRPTQIKQLMMDQRRIAGLGNIYTDEILFEAGINPVRTANSLEEHEIHRLFMTLQAVLSEAIRLRGTSISDYVDTLGRKGQMQTRHKVYGRTGQSCPRCGEDIQRIRVGGRSAHFCPSCQR